MTTNEALLNIRKLAASGYDAATMTPTRRMYPALDQISVINHQEVKDHDIACILADIVHRCPVTRLRAIEKRAASILEVAKRQRVERSIARRVILDAVKQGFVIDVNDGEEITLRNATSSTVILKAMMTTDEDYLILRRHNADGTVTRGWVRFVYGNGGWDVICDYSVNLDEVLAGANALAERLEAR
jgi:hypothetical protein